MAARSSGMPKALPELSPEDLQGNIKSTEKPQFQVGSSSKMQLERDSNCWLLLCASLTESSHFAADVVHGFGIRRIFGFDFFEVLVDDAAPAALIFDLLALNITEGIVLTLTDDFACEMTQGREFSFSSPQFCSNAFCVRSSSKTIDSLEGHVS